MTIEELKHKLSKLKEEHRALDDEITFLLEKPLHDQVTLQRLKKKKLYIRDKILNLQTKLIPDIIA